MPFLLNRQDRPDGTTHLTYDIGPTERANILAPLANAHLTEFTPPSDLLDYTLSTVRPPTSARRSIQ
jgi:hypothetical protein